MNHRAPSSPLLRPGPHDLASVLLAAALLTAPAHAQWTATVLEPPGAVYSECNRVHDGQQIGYVDFGNGPEAALWSGTAASFVDLHPSGAPLSQARGVQGGRQVGHSYPHAGYWTGSAASFVDLNPVGASESIAYDIVGNTIVGEAHLGATVASRWDATTLVWTNLHPIGTSASASSLRATDGVQQAGRATIGGKANAMVWAGTNTSWVNLHPAGVTSSFALGVDAGQQVGVATYTFTDHAALWNGTAASFVDLQPAGVIRSQATGVHQGQQCGWVDYATGQGHAVIWSGTAASMQDLHSALPPSFVGSQAYGIWHDVLGTTYVVGTGKLGGRNYAVLWVRQAPVWTDLGFAKAGGTGVPHLIGSGALTVGSLNTLSLTGAQPSSTAVLVLGVLPAYAPFLGGVLVPDLMLLLPLPTDAAGAVDFQVTVPGGLPIGLPLRFQHWIEDPAVSFGYSASNGVLGILQ